MDKAVLKYLSMVIGIVVTVFLLLAFGLKIGSLFIEKGASYFVEVARSFVNWYDNPTAFFFSYIIGYTIAWWKPLPGSVIILFGSLLLFFFNISNIALLIFILPAIIVAVLNILYWKAKK